MLRVIRVWYRCHLLTLPCCLPRLFFDDYNSASLLPRPLSSCSLTWSAFSTSYTSFPSPPVTESHVNKFVWTSFAIILLYYALIWVYSSVSSLGSVSSDKIWQIESQVPKLGFCLLFCACPLWHPHYSYIRLYFKLFSPQLVMPLKQTFTSFTEIHWRSRITFSGLFKEMREELVGFLDLLVIYLVDANVDYMAVWLPVLHFYQIIYISCLTIYFPIRKWLV